jgi:glycerophosphoryl diester phosphodiesterase
VFEPFKKPHILIAHRGYRAIAPENTIYAFSLALGKFDMFEFDVRFTKDNIPIVFHDEDLLRCTNVKDIYNKSSYFVKDFTYDELKKLDNVSWFYNTNPFNMKLSSIPEEKNAIPTLYEVLEFIKKTGFYANLEIKNSHLPEKEVKKIIFSAIKDYGLEDLLIISSFNHNYIKNIPFYSAPLFEKKVPYDIKRYLLKIKADAYHIDKTLVNEKIIKELNCKGIVTNVYTVNFGREKFFKKA